MSLFRSILVSAIGFVALGVFLPDPNTAHGAAPPGVLGTNVKMEAGRLTITAVHDNYPASRQGLRPGDCITSIDGRSTLNTSLDQCLDMLAGAAGESVTLTITRGSPGEHPFEVTLVRQSRSGPAASQSEPVQWKGNKIVSRVLPYPDFNSFFVRLPIAHAAATGKGVKAVVLSRAENKSVISLLQAVAPQAEVISRICRSEELDVAPLAEWPAQNHCREVVIPDVPQWPGAVLIGLAERFLAERILLLIPSDLSEMKDQIDTVNRLQELGALTVGRVGQGSGVSEREPGGRRPFNRRIREIRTDVFSTAGMFPEGHACDPVATTGGVAALLLEKWPEMSPTQVRERIVNGARHVWQGTSIETGQWAEMLVDSITTEYKPKDERTVFHYRVLDAAGALGVDTEIPWFLNMLNCQKAWEVSKGRGVVVLVSDQGFHLRHPELLDHIYATKHFGPVSVDRAEQHFHGTEMSRILLAVAPEARIVPVLCSGSSFEELATNITRSFRYATEIRADAVSASWAGYFNTNQMLVAAARDAVDHGALLSWFHYPNAYRGLLRSRFVYWGWEGASLGFADRFLTDPPGFHPVEIEAGLSGTAPQAAGIAALIKSVNPGLTPQQVEDLIVQNATPIGLGVLIPDAHRAVLAAQKRNSTSKLNRNSRQSASQPSPSSK